MKITEKGRLGPVEIPAVLPLLPLRDLVVFPHMVVPLFVGREKSVAALEAAMEAKRLILLAAQRDASQDNPAPEGIYTIGTLAEILQLLKLPDGTIKVLVEGIQRLAIRDFLPSEAFYEVRAEALKEEPAASPETTAILRNAVSLFEQYVKMNRRIPGEVVVSVSNEEDPARAADAIAGHMVIQIKEKQVILETLEVKKRLELLSQKLAGEIEILKLEKKIRGEVRSQMETTQREYYLSEQLKAIQKELGKQGEGQEEIEELKKKIKAAGMPKAVKEKADRELRRLEMMNPMSAESTVVRTYLDWLVEVPWSKKSKDKLDIAEAEKILNEDHWGLEKVKERILEYLAVRSRAPELKGPILCFVGPPGTGKTSLGRSIARSLGREFVRVSLGGVRDEAEIRGHRRTYIGALPGRLIQGMRRAGTVNPVFLLDEVDKMSMDFRGDPSAALLEVLDPEQNKNFQDHYLDIDYDLSQVLFITTANVLHPVPRPLLDRMEVIAISGYTEEEKVEIGERFLIPRQRTEHALKAEEFDLPRGVLLRIIREYTREAGVRNLERQIARTLRKVARDLVEADREAKKEDGDKEVETAPLTQIHVTPARLHKYLGPPKFHDRKKGEKDEPGVAMGLAWTEVGGEILAVEALKMPGKGSLTITGQLGEVMQESARAALSYARAQAKDLGIADDFFRKVDLHIHVPEGAIPKDGPSAGITMATALVSILSGRPVRKDIAMTGEITLRGKVLPIGGLKEKLLAALRAGIHEVIVPSENERDMEEIPKNLQKKMTVHFVKEMDEVLKTALATGGKKK